MSLLDTLTCVLTVASFVMCLSSRGVPVLEQFPKLVDQSKAIEQGEHARFFTFSKVKARGFAQFLTPKQNGPVLVQTHEYVSILRASN